MRRLTLQKEKLRLPAYLGCSAKTKDGDDRGLEIINQEHYMRKEEKKTLQAL